jgi:hypothetical protein
MRDFVNYWNDGNKVLSMREGYYSELPTILCECANEEEAQETAHIWQQMELEEWNK